LFILAAAVALPCSWLASQLAQAREQDTILAKIRKLDGYYFLDWALDKNGDDVALARPPEPDWLRRCLGGDFFDEVAIVSLFDSAATDSDLSEVARLAALQRLDIPNTRVTDAGLANLSRMTRLKSLWLGGTEITDSALEYLARLPQLKELWLDNTRISDTGLKRLHQILPNCNITNRVKKQT
jgi:hypothetical protein